jgi:hypothetical protein
MVHQRLPIYLGISKSDTIHNVSSHPIVIDNLSDDGDLSSQRPVIQEDNYNLARLARMHHE